jgi:hypothetical protein
MKLEYGKITAAVQREPVEISVLMRDQRQSGPFVTNREQRGVVIADSANQIRLTNDEALTLLSWLYQQEPTLRAMVDEENEMLTPAQPGHRPGTEETLSSHPSQAEGDPQTIEEDLRRVQPARSQATTGTPGRPSQAEGEPEPVEEKLGERTAGQRQQPDVTPGRPSQAEGDPQTVEEDLRRKKA